MRLHAYLQSARSILQQYNGAVPFAAWLKDYFRQHKKFGSRDRKIVSDLCYCFYRLGKAFSAKSMEERLILAQFLCHRESAFVNEVRPDLQPLINAAIEEKWNAAGGGEELSIFPFSNELSREIDEAAFQFSHLVQPDLFLRARPGKKEKVIEKLRSAAIPFTGENDCIRLANTTKIDGIIELDREAVVQDKSSQQVLDPLKEHWQKTSFTSWDCCAASGGKTILLHDLFPKAHLSVSDIRESILHNLRNRFRRAGINQYQSFVGDASAASFRSNRTYDVILCDAPCSGSGTWGRTPEQLAFFSGDKIDYYANLQKSIAVNAARSLKQGGAFVYITCSVFSKENEEVVQHILANTSLQLLSQQYVKGYTEKADTLFVALFAT